jgi:hypothetical protein
MPSYEPINIAGDVDCLTVDLLSFSWEDGVATFGLSGGRTLRVLFPGQVIVRMLDELALSTEDRPSDRRGLIAHHFAYRVSGDPFADIQSKVWLNEGLGPCRHYRFITGGGCLDVLAHIEPEWQVQPSNAPR